MIKSLREARITDGLPKVVAGQEWVVALSEALGLAFEKVLDFTDKSQIYTRIDEVPETVLDALAVNWKIDWYDTDLDIDQKRRTVKTALTVRRLMGTVQAVRLQADAIYPGAVVEEWFQYGGDPGRFRVRVNLPDGGITADEYKRLIHGIEITKNLRSHLDDIDIRRETEGALVLGGVTAMSQTVEIWPGLTTQVDISGAVETAGATTTRRVVEIFPERGG